MVIQSEIPVPENGGFSFRKQYLLALLAVPGLFPPTSLLHEKPGRRRDPPGIPYLIDKTLFHVFHVRINIRAVNNQNTGVNILLESPFLQQHQGVFQLTASPF